MTDKPVTREEKYLAYLTGDYTGEIPKPITRKEKYLYELCLKGIGGEISPEEIKNAVNEYLEKNPVKPGATTEQAQQIEQNKTDVASLKEETGSLKEDLVELEASKVDNHEVKDFTAKSNDDKKDALYITDSNGNVIFKADKNGIKGLNMDNNGTSSPFKGMKLLSIGDSLSAHDKWQKWLVEWLGLNFDLDENINGKDGHAPMSVGGTGIRPKGTNSIYIRALDAKYYVDDVNGTIIIIYAGQNDYLGTGNRLLGTIEDIPYKGRAVSTDADSLTFYSFYKGMIENLLEDCPKARICLMTQMQIWQSENTVENGETEAVRFEKVKAIREIGNYYGLTVIDQWSNSGINHLNASVYYPSIGNVHQNDLGYKVTAETVCKYL